jgi:hypothetical protein
MSTPDRRASATILIAGGPVDGSSVFGEPLTVLTRERYLRRLTTRCVVRGPTARYLGPELYV